MVFSDEEHKRGSREEALRHRKWAGRSIYGQPAYLILIATVRAARAARSARIALILGLVDPNRAAVDLAPVERANDRSDIGNVDLDETKSAGSTSVAIG